MPRATDLKRQIEQLGYEVYTTNRGVGSAPWVVTVFVGSEQKGFTPECSEVKALEEALKVIEGLVSEARMQEERWRCEGCGD